MKYFKNVKLSLYFKLMLIVIIWGLMINISIFIYTRYSSDFKSPRMFPVIMEKLSLYMTKDIGYPPDTTKALQFASELKLSIRYISPALNWATDSDVPQLDTLLNYDDEFADKFSRNEMIRVRYEGRGYVVIKDPRGIYLFRFPLPEEIINVERAIFIIFLLTSVILISLYFVIRKLIAPVKTLASVVDQIGKGDFNIKMNTERKDEFGDLARAIDRMRNNLKQLINAKEQLLIDVSHELRTPLTRVKLGLALNSPPEKINDDIREVEFLITNILEGYKNDYSILKEEFYLSDVIEAISEEFEIYKHRIIISNEFKPDYKINADEQKLIIIFRNLIQNSIKYSGDSGKIKITIKNKTPYTEFIFEDEGIGIKESDLEKVFEPFFRSDFSRSKKTGGYGLGLYIVKKYVTLHEGNISVESQLNKGTKIVFTIKNKV